MAEWRFWMEARLWIPFDYYSLLFIIVKSEITCVQIYRNKVKQKSHELTGDTVLLVDKTIRDSRLSHLIKVYLQQSFFAPSLLRRQPARRHTVTCARIPLLFSPLAFFSATSFRLHLTNLCHQEKPFACSSDLSNMTKPPSGTLLAFNLPQLFFLPTFFFCQHLMVCPSFLSFDCIFFI